MNTHRRRSVVCSPRCTIATLTESSGMNPFRSAASDTWFSLLAASSIVGLDRFADTISRLRADRSFSLPLAYSILNVLRHCPAAVMKSLMFSVSHNSKILRSVIASIMINVVYSFFQMDLSAKKFFHNDNMLPHLAVMGTGMIRGINKYISVVINTSSSLPIRMPISLAQAVFRNPLMPAMAATEIAGLCPCNLGWISGQGLTAPFARYIDLLDVHVLCSFDDTIPDKGAKRQALLSKWRDTFTRAAKVAELYV